ncbi:MAG: hypothetical protein OXH06_02305 [Gemmatimonadetes bacterium]|nr:hypothetical protein [Gemmatimonadota bacterium]
MNKRSKRAARRSATPRHEASKTLSDRFAPWLASPWAPVVFFLLLSVVYFAGFVFTDHVILGQDTGREFHKGREPFVEKLSNLVPANWTRFLGGTPVTGQRTSRYFPLEIIALFTTRHRLLGWRYFFAMFMAGYFMYLCIRGFGLRPLTAWLTGIAYASAPALLTFIYAGHEAKMLVIGLFPLMVWGLYRGMETGRMIYYLVLGVAIGAGIYTPHLQMLYYALFGLAILFAGKLIHLLYRDKCIAAALRRSLLSAGSVCLGLGIGAMGVFPQYWYTRTESRRALGGGEGKGLEYAQTWSLHPEEIASLVVPEFAHFDDPDRRQRNYWGRNPFKLNSEYFGIAVLFFAALALGRIRRDPNIGIFLLLFFFALAFALGPHTFVHGYAYRYIPGMKVLRAPGMIAFLFAFPACVLAAIGLQRVLYPTDVSPRTRRNLAVGAAVAVALLLVVALAPQSAVNAWTGIFWSDIPESAVRVAQANAPNLSRGAIFAALLVSVLAILTWRRLGGGMSPVVYACLLVPLMLFDTWRIDRQFLRYFDPDLQPPPERVYGGVLRHFEQDPDLYRVLIVSQLPIPIPGSDSGARTIIDKVRVDQHEPFTMLRYDRMTEPRYLRHFPILNLLNTRYVVSRDPFPDGPASVVTNGLHIYKNDFALPWFYLAPGYRIETDEDRILELLSEPGFRPDETVILEAEPGGFSPDSVDTRSQDHVEKVAYAERSGHIELNVKAGGPRLLVISENYHPFWHAWVDGEERPLFRVNYAWKAVVVPGGEHRVVLRFHDPIATACRWITLLSTLFAIACAAWYWRQRSGKPAAAAAE